MIKFNFSYIILFIVVAACGSPKSDEEFIVQNGDTMRIVKEYNQEGRLNTESTIDKDNLRQGIAKMFYEDGKLYAEIYFKNGKKHGLEKSYYESGNIKHIGLNDSGKQDSTWVWYYESGAVRKKDNWINDASHGESISYYENGMVEIFRFYYFGELLYIREYDRAGNIIKDEGKTPLGIIYNKNHLNINEGYNIAIFVGLLPDWDATLEILDVTDRRKRVVKKVDNKNGFEKVRWGHRIVVEEVASKSGSYNWLVNIMITDENGKKMEYSKVFTRTVTNE